MSTPGDDEPRSELTFVSTNADKVREVRRILAPFGLRVAWKRRALPEPQAERIEEVVAAKLDAVRDLPGLVMVEDSGLFIPSLGGFPGVYSAHFLRLWKFGPVLELLRTRARAAYYQSVVGVQRGDRRWTFGGEVVGAIAESPAGRGGFGYDPIFVPQGWTRTFAEGTDDEKNEISHRGRAVRQVGEMFGRAPSGKRAPEAPRRRAGPRRT
jgi:XTP/dITP diphosphohydrolase